MGMANFFRSFMPAYSQMAAPLTDLLKASSSAQKVNLSPECETAFNLIKSMLTSVPVSRHFDPALRTAVHVDGSQNAAGDVLLQWQPGEFHPQPVAFMSQKLASAQYLYDVRNVNALAVQMALLTWCINLLGVLFELYSDHDIYNFSSRKNHPLSEFCACAISWLSTTSKRLSKCLTRTTWYQISSLGHGRVARAPLHVTCWYNQSLHDCPVCTVYSARYIRL